MILIFADAEIINVKLETVAILWQNSFGAGELFLFLWYYSKKQ